MAANVNTFLDAVKDLTTEQLKLITDEVVKTYAYAGFDPQQVFETLLNRGTNKRKDLNVIVKDVSEMIAIFLLRGSKVMFNQRKSTAAAWSALEKLKRDYEIKANPNTVKDLTLPRIAAAFPGITLKIAMSNDELDRPFSRAMIKSITQIEIATPYKLQAIICVLPKDTSKLSLETTRRLLSGVLSFLYLEGKVINSKKQENHNPQFQLEQITVFMKLAYNATHISEDEKGKIWDALQIKYPAEESVLGLAAIYRHVKTMIPSVVTVADEMYKSLGVSDP